jgi:predicted transcriptional regulator
LPGERQWKPRTLKTLLNRLVRKGAVAMETDGDIHLSMTVVFTESPK